MEVHTVRALIQATNGFHAVPLWNRAGVAANPAEGHSVRAPQLQRAIKSRNWGAQSHKHKHSKAPEHTSPPAEKKEAEETT